MRIGYQAQLVAFRPVSNGVSRAVPSRTPSEPQEPVSADQFGGIMKIVALGLLSAAIVVGFAGCGGSDTPGIAGNAAGMGSGVGGSATISPSKTTGGTPSASGSGGKAASSGGAAVVGVGSGGTPSAVGSGGAANASGGRMGMMNTGGRMGMMMNACP